MSRPELAPTALNNDQVLHERSPMLQGQEEMSELGAVAAVAVASPAVGAAAVAPSTSTLFSPIDRTTTFDATTLTTVGAAVLATKQQQQETRKTQAGDHTNPDKQQNTPETSQRRADFLCGLPFEADALAPTLEAPYASRFSAMAAGRRTQRAFEALYGEQLRAQYDPFYGPPVLLGHNGSGATNAASAGRVAGADGTGVEERLLHT